MLAAGVAAARLWFGWLHDSIEYSIICLFIYFILFIIYLFIYLFILFTLCWSQAGARKIYAVEAAGIVGYTQQLADGNPDIGKKLSIVHSKIEELELPEQVSDMSPDLFN